MAIVSSLETLQLKTTTDKSVPEGYQVKPVSDYFKDLNVGFVKYPMTIK